MLAHALLGAVMETAMVVARAPLPAKVRKDAERARVDAGGMARPVRRRKARKAIRPLTGFV